MTGKPAVGTLASRMREAAALQLLDGNRDAARWMYRAAARLAGQRTYLVTFEGNRLGAADDVEPLEVAADCGDDVRRAVHDLAELTAGADACDLDVVVDLTDRDRGDGHVFDGFDTLAYFTVETVR